jgi:hypothetical protein
MRLSNKQLALIGGIVAVGLAGTAGFWLLGKSESGYRGPSPAIGRTRAAIHELLVDLRIAIQGLLGKSESGYRGPSHAIGRTRAAIHELLLDLGLAIQEMGYVPGVLVSSGGQPVDTKRLYAMLYEDNAAGLPTPVFLSSLSRESKDLLDVWGKPFNIVVQSNGPADFTIRIWSNGPNGKNEAGQGDDVTGRDALRVKVGAEGPEIDFSVVPPTR